MANIGPAGGAPQPRHPANILRRGLLTALLAASLTLGAALAPLAGAAPSSHGHMHSYGPCPGVQIAC